jgi:hypothetical protein
MSGFVLFMWSFLLALGLRFVTMYLSSVIARPSQSVLALILQMPHVLSFMAIVLYWGIALAHQPKDSPYRRPENVVSAILSTACGALVGSFGLLLGGLP